MSQLPALADVLDETAVLNGLANRHNGFHLEPRCRVCRNDTLRSKVNNLLASGASYAMILRAPCGMTTPSSTSRTGSPSTRSATTPSGTSPCRTSRRPPTAAILERRAQENGVDFVNGVATAITPMAFYETVMVKGYETLVDPGTRVDVNTGMIAACSAASADGIPGQRYPHRRPQGAGGAHQNAIPLPACQRSCGRRSFAR